MTVNIIWETCYCGRVVPHDELMVTYGMSEFPGYVACGGCRFLAVAEGRISRYELCRRDGASPEKLDKIRSMYGE